jgi:hypothetical protein
MEQQNPKLPLRPGIIAILVVWVLVLALGIWKLEKYSNTPNLPGREIASLPTAAGIALDPAKPSVLLFAHPLCSCSRASLTELARLALNFKNRFKPIVVFYVPKNQPAEWTGSDLVEQAREIPDALVNFDPEGKMAKEIGARTSGQTYVFSPDGKLQFMGGITGARGHEGENRGSRAIAALLEGGKTNDIRYRVFGCSLFKQSAELTNETEEQR